jgi:hypothetical protein
MSRRPMHVLAPCKHMHEDKHERTAQEMKRSNLSNLLTWGKYAYRSAAFAYSAFAVYENPWLIRAVLSAMWSASAVLFQVVR